MIKGKGNHEELNIYFSGKKLYGDDFKLTQIKGWFDDEKEAYSNLISNSYIYEFHALNKIHGYNKLRLIKEFDKVLGFGGAYGDEFLPILNKIREIYIIEPSEKLIFLLKEVHLEHNLLYPLSG